MEDIVASQVHGKSIMFTLHLDDAMFEILLLARFLDGMNAEAVTRHALDRYLEDLRERGDYKMALSLKKHHDKDVEKWRQLRKVSGGEDMGGHPGEIEEVD